MMKSIPPMNELFEQAGMELPNFLGTKVEEAAAVSESEPAAAEPVEVVEAETVFAEE